MVNQNSDSTSKFALRWDISMKVSVIIATKNEEKNIENCLIALCKQSYKDFELIVVDNNSTDKTVEIAKKYTNFVYELNSIENISKVKNFRGAQINFGVSKSKGDIVFFPDADMIFDINLLKEVVGRSNEADAFFVPEIVIGKGLLGKIRNFERAFYNNTCIDAIRFIKKDIFILLNGFDTENIEFGPDDWDFTKTIKKSGFRLGITHSGLYHNEESMSWKYYLIKKSKYANTFRQYIAKWGKGDNDIQNQFSIFYRYFGVFVENGKWIKLLKNPFLTIGMYCLKFSIGVFYIIKK